MTIIHATISSITYASTDDGADAPCTFVWPDGRTENHPKSWGGFFRGVIGGRNANGDEVEWADGTGMLEAETVASAFTAAGGSIGAYVAPPPPEEPVSPP